MHKSLYILIVSIFCLYSVNYAKAAETTTDTAEITNTTKSISIPTTEELTATYQEIKTERETIKQQIQEIEKEIDHLADSEKEKAINKKIQLYMKDYKVVAKEAAYEKALEIKQPGYKETSTTTNTNNDFSFTPEKLISNIDPPSAYIKYYIAASEKYNVEWQVLAAIHKIETNYSTHTTMISSVGAIGHMQFMPSTWSAYGVDADGDGKRNPWSVQDAIYSAANYLDANGFSKNPRRAIWHYNHAEWYVNDVIQTASRITING